MILLDQLCRLATLKYRPKLSLLSACCLSLNTSRGGEKNTFTNLCLTLSVAVICCRARVSVHLPISGVEAPTPLPPKGPVTTALTRSVQGSALELCCLIIAADRCSCTCDIAARRINSTQIKAIVDLNVSCLREK